MFGGSRKRGAAAQPLTRDTADSDAATAAASAFMRRQSNPSLSSAAAAAALKARPMTPTNVAEVQSKRTMRRSPSVSSMTGRRRELTRTPSVGSMMERTFRSPSPGRSARPASRDAPPVPTLPGSEDLSSNDRRGPRLQTQNFQTASQKLKKDQGSWFGAAAAGNPATVRRASSALQLSSRGPPEPRPGSVSPSINFSYPRARMHSPSESVQSEPADEHTLVYDPNSRRMVPRRDFARRSLSVRGIPEEKPLKKKKSGVSRSGSYLSKGTLGRTQTRSAEDLRESAASRSQDAEENVQPENVTRPVLAKKPSIVREEPEEEDIEQQASPSQLAIKTTPTKPAGKKNKKKKKTNSANDATSPSNKSVSQSRPDRVPSESPARSTRFASSTDQLVVRHEPPARSLSPRKSALKHSSPTRAISPSDDGSEASALALNTEDAMARKKSARVSWDDRNTVVVGESVQPQETESPMIPSPQAKKPWHGLLAAKQGKKDAITVDKEETMAPRPALPSFGSVREKKTKEPEERPLVRPAERAWSPQPSSTDAGESSDGVSVPDNTTKNVNGVNSETAPAAAVSTEAPDESSSDGGLMDDTSEDELNAQERDASAEVPAISISYPSPRLPNENDALREQNSNLESRDVSTPTPTSQMDDIEEEEDNAADHYSDAYEEISEVEGDGFMSLDAVLENTPDSPTTKPTPANVPTDSNNNSANVNDVAAPEEQDDWENAKAYWKSLSLDQRRQLEVEALTEGEDTGKKKVLSSSQPDEKLPVSKHSTERSYQIQPGTSWDTTKHDTVADPSKSGKLRQSLRQTDTNPSPRLAHPGSVTMRKSMREARPTSAHGSPQTLDSAPDGAVHMKKSLRQRPATADAQRRPVSYHDRSSEVVRSHQHNLSDDGPASPTSPGRGASKRTTLRRRGSDSSESSFTRKRAGSSGAYEFRRSMRGSMREAPSTTPSNKDANRFSLRSLSPTGFRRNSVSSVSAAAGAGAGFGAGRMRQSLRGESIGATPRKRMSTFGRSPGKASKGRSGSRFADSSDEEEQGQLQMFRSRFADSSDEEEEEARPASQGRGIAKTLRSKSSRATASAIDLRSSTNRFEPSALAIDNDILQPKQELALPPAIATDERTNHSRRGSFISILRRKKDPNANILGRTNSEVGNVPNSGAHKRDSSWPLPDGDNGEAGPANTSPGDSEVERPSTAGGPIADTNTKASKFARRRSASQGMVGLNHTTLDDQPETPQKKKKFSGLRKMLGIHD